MASQVSSSMLTAQGITSVSLSKNLQYKVAVSPTEGYIHDNPVNGSGDFIQQVIGGYNTIFSKNGRFLLV